MPSLFGVGPSRCTLTPEPSGSESKHGCPAGSVPERITFEGNISEGCLLLHLRFGAALTVCGEMFRLLGSSKGTGQHGACPP